VFGKRFAGSIPKRSTIKPIEDLRVGVVGALAHQPQVGLVHQSRGLQRVIRPFHGEQPLRQAAQFVIDERRHLV